MTDPQAPGTVESDRSPTHYWSSWGFATFFFLFSIAVFLLALSVRLLNTPGHEWGYLALIGSAVIGSGLVLSYSIWLKHWGGGPAADRGAVLGVVSALLCALPNAGDFVQSVVSGFHPRELDWSDLVGWSLAMAGILVTTWALKLSIDADRQWVSMVIRYSNLSAGSRPGCNDISWAWGANPKWSDWDRTLDPAGSADAD